MYSYRPKNRTTLTEAAVYGVILFVLAALVVGVVGGLVGGVYANYSEGERAGTVYKVSHKGLIWKSYECEINLGGIAADANGQVTANRFKFSVRDPEVVKRLNEASTSGKRVTLHYHQYLIKPISLDTDYVVDSVKGIEGDSK